MHARLTPVFRGLLALLAHAACLGPAPASAHMPLVRGLVVSGDGQQIAARMPGFGWLMGSAQDGPLAYLCDGLVGVAADEVDTPWVLQADGSLLIGTSGGLRRVTSDGCPDRTFAGGFDESGVAAMAVHRDSPGLVYVASAGEAPALYRSEDGGRSFERRAGLPVTAPTTGLIVTTEDPRVLYVSQTVAANRTALSRSGDGGISFSMQLWDGDLAPLHALSGSSDLWARSAHPDAHQVSIVRSSEPDGPLEPLLDLHFFGGFAYLSGSEQLWAGDEGGGLYRLQAGEDAFTAVQSDTATACLAAGPNSLWACTPGLPQRPAIGRIDDQGLVPAFALADVRDLVACEPAGVVERACAAAWAEWEVDVLKAAGVALSPDTGPDAPISAAGSDPDAGKPVSEAPKGSWESEAHRDAGVTSAHRPPVDRSGCAISPGSDSRRPGLPSLLGLTFLLLVHVRRTERRIAVPSPPMSAEPRGPAKPTERSPLQALDDARLLTRARTGDVDAFAEIYDRHAPGLLALAQRMLANASDAHDLLQDVFIEAWQAVRTYDPDRASVLTWLRVRTRSRALDRMGRRARETAALAVMADAGRPEGRKDTELDIGVGTREVLHELDTDVRCALELRYYAGMTALEIAERTGVPEGTVRSRLARGLRQLSARLREDEEPGHGD